MATAQAEVMYALPKDDGAGPAANNGSDGNDAMVAGAAVPAQFDNSPEAPWQGLALQNLDLKSSSDLGKLHFTPKKLDDVVTPALSPGASDYSTIQ